MKTARRNGIFDLLRHWKVFTAVASWLVLSDLSHYFSASFGKSTNCMRRTCVCSPFFTILLLVSFVIFSDAQNTNINPGNVQTVDSLLIKNVYLISREDSLGDIKVNMLIIGKRLQLVTKDEVLFGPGVRTLDGDSGFLMGNVAIGQEPSFVILDENPREKFDVFLNTDAHVRFAMEKGIILSNKLRDIAVSERRANQKKLTWTAYQPPAMAVPINYYNSRKWNKFNTKIISGLFNGVLGLDVLSWLSQDDNSHQQVGDLSSSSIGAIRALRFGVIGTLNFKRPWVYTVFFTNSTFDRSYNASTDNRLVLFDLRFDIPLAPKLNLSVGKQKEPISMERLMSLIFLPQQERAATADAFLPSRNWGILLNGKLFGDRGTWAGGVFNNALDSDTSFEATPTQITGRLTGLPFLSADGSNLLHLGLGVRYSTADLPLKGKADAEFFQAPAFVKSDDIPANNLLTYVLETYWRKGPFMLGMEYMGNWIQSDIAGNPYTKGWNVTGSWIVTGEMRNYRKRSGIFDPVPVSKPVGQGGWGAVELTSRYSSIDLTDAGIAGGTMRTISAGANWWLSAKAQFGANYRFINLDKNELRGNSSGINFRLMLILD
jgi:phosphate-selective porin OprO/OprP